jgi:hypothetical protein
LRATATTAADRMAPAPWRFGCCVKTGASRRRRALADSLLDSRDADSTGSAKYAAGLAALAGEGQSIGRGARAVRGIRIATGPGGERPDLPDP